MDKLLNSLQHKLVKLEKSELDLLSKQSQDEAVKIALVLASQPAPPIPEFELDSKYHDAESIADLVDDVFGKVGNGEGYSEGVFDDKEERKESKHALAISDTEATKVCKEWKQKYEVVIGVSWGNLPFDLQQQWMEYSCDYHLAEEK